MGVLIKTTQEMLVQREEAQYLTFILSEEIVEVKQNFYVNGSDAEAQAGFMILYNQEPFNLLNRKYYIL